jgi:hypothetical protein
VFEAAVLRPRPAVLACVTVPDKSLFGTVLTDDECHMDQENPCYNQRHTTLMSIVGFGLEVPGRTAITRVPSRPTRTPRGQGLQHCFEQEHLLCCTFCRLEIPLQSVLKHNPDDFTTLKYLYDLVIKVWRRKRTPAAQA